MSGSEYDLRPERRARPEYTVTPGGKPRADYTLAWEFDDDSGDGTATAGPPAPGAPRKHTHAQPAAQNDPTPTLADAFRGPAARTRVDAVRRELRIAVDLWYRSGTLPPDAVLRDGLLVLEAGNPLDEAQRTLLARTALARGRGIFTALRHQTDPDRIATLVHEAVMNGALTPNGLRALLVDDTLPPQWVRALAEDLQAGLAAPTTALRAQAALNLIEAARQRAAAPADGLRTLTPDGPSRAWVRVAAALLLIGALLLLWFWRTRAVVRTGPSRDLITIAAGNYLLADANGASTRVDLAAFSIQRTEVTNEAFAACVDAGVCAAPNPNAAMRNPALARHPMTNLTHDAAARYCAWRGLRLPSAAEWQVAAGFAPATNRVYRFPWGEVWEPAFVIGGVENGFSSSAPVGARSPAGDSPLGAADMAGNAAEWTATTAPGAAAAGSSAAPVTAIVKGGSYRDPAPAFQVSAFVNVETTTAAAWLGFRCAGS